MLQNGSAVDGTQGGLILGPSHDDGGINMLVRKEGKYYLEGEVEGGEYVFNWGATERYKGLMPILNNPTQHKRPTYTPVEIPQGISIINARQHGLAKFIIFECGGFAIFNKFSTAGYLQTLENLNNATSYELVDEKHAQLIFNNTEPIDICFYDKYESTVYQNGEKK